MDFVAFYVWRKHFAIGEMVKAPIRPTTCHRIYKELVEAGLAKIDKDGFHTLTSAATEEFIASEHRLARLGMNALVKDNQRLIRKLVAQLSKRSIARLEEDDIFQAGLMAFMRALEKFDPDRFADKKQGASFSTYLRHWVRHFLQASRLDQQTIKKPRGYGMPASVYAKATEIFERTGVRATPEQLGTWKDGKKERPVTQELLDKWAAERSVIVSMDAMKSSMGSRLNALSECDEFMPFGVQQQSEITGDLPDSSKSPEQLLERAQLAQKAEEAVASLCPSDRLLMEEMRDGVSSKQTAKRLKVTEDYVRKLRRALTDELQRKMGKMI